MSSEELANLVVAFGRDGRGPAAGIGAWPKGAGLVAEANEVVDRVDGDPEEAGDLRGGTNAAIDGVDDPLPEFDGIGIHGKIHPRPDRRIGATVTIV